VRPPLEQTNLKEIFTHTVFKLLLDQDLPVLSEVRKSLQQIIAPMAEKIESAGKFCLRAIEMAVLFILKRTMDNVDKMWITIHSRSNDLATKFGLRLTGSQTVNSYYLPINLPIRC
jgi:hypothetical protein